MVQSKHVCPEPVGTVGDMSRNTLRDPGLTQWDASVNKDTAWVRMDEGGAIQFRSEIFNVLKHPGLRPADDTIFAGNIGDKVEKPNTTAMTNQSKSSHRIQFS